MESWSSAFAFRKDSRRARGTYLVNSLSLSQALSAAETAMLLLRPSLYRGKRINMLATRRGQQ